MNEMYIKVIQPFSKVLFDKQNIYVIDLSETIQFGPINKEVLANIFKDGRVSGLIAEHLLIGLFKNLARSPIENSSYDVFDTKWGTSFEVRCITENGLRTMPSYMIGQGRVYNLKEHMEKLFNIDYFIFIDVTNSPIFKIIPIKSDERLLFKNIGCKTFYSKFVN